jgi:hypothetical protein
MVGYFKFCEHTRRPSSKRIPTINRKYGIQMFASDDECGHAENASYAAYTEAVKAAYKTLADLITDYFDEHPEFYNNEVLDVPTNFRPLKDFERTLKIQKLTLRLALRTAELSQHKIANSIGPAVHTNGRGRIPVVLTLPATEGRSDGEGAE